MTEKRSVPTRFLDTIAGKITLRTMILAGIPLLVIGVITAGGLLFLSNNAGTQLEESNQSLATETVGAARETEAQLLVQQMDAFIAERIDDSIDWASSDIIVEAAKADYEVLEPAEGETSINVIPVGEAAINAVDERFKDQTLGDAAINDYLVNEIKDRKVSDQVVFGEVFFTQAAGFNVAASGPTSDFVQSDEGWWTNAWEQRVSLGPIEFDDSVGAFSFDISVRIDDPANGNKLGVLKAVVRSEVIQVLSDRVADDAKAISVRVITSEGLVISETASNHSPETVGTIAVYEGDKSRAFNDAKFSEASSGNSILDTSVVGFSKTSSTRTVERISQEIPNQNWIAFVEQDEGEALAAIKPLEELRSRLSSAALLLILLIGAVILGTLVLSFVFSRAVANRIAQPINALRDEAQRVAEEELPQLVELLRTPGGEGRIPTYEPIDVNADGEVGDLTAAFNSVRSTAVEIAGGQVLARNKDVASLLLNLGRRNQQLIGRQLKFIDDLEQTESNPDTLKNLFQLDQMATRMRRNAESLLVLAGEDSRRRGSKPMPVKQVVRAASGEVEDYARVQVSAMESALLVPQVVSDITHLMAELIENAASFSPPDSPVEILGAHTQNGSYTISIIDHGVGMETERLAQFNARLRGENVGEDAPSTFLGLYVVGRLATRHGIYARLVESATTGITAKLTLPPTCLVTQDATMLPSGNTLQSLQPPTLPASQEISSPIPPSLLPPMNLAEAQPNPPAYAAPTTMGIGQIGQGQMEQTASSVSADARVTKDIGDSGFEQRQAPPAPQMDAPQMDAPQAPQMDAPPLPDQQGSVYTNEFHLPEFQPRTPTTPLEPTVGDPNEVPIPPFTPRQSTAATPAAGAESRPDQPVTKAKAEEVRDRLERFSDGVVTAKAAARNEIEREGDKEAEQVRTQLTAFTQGIEKARSESTDQTREE